MTLDDAIADLQTRIMAVCPSAVIRITRVSPEEARVRAYAPADAADPIRDATRERTIELLTSEGLDLQVLPYDIATDLPPES